MRILHASDLHYSLPQFDWVVGEASDFDLVTLAGDHLKIGSLVPLETQSETVLEYFSLLHSAGPLAVCSGNHDLTGPDAEGERSALWLSAAEAAGVPTDGSFRVDRLHAGDGLSVVGRTSRTRGTRGTVDG